MNTAKNLQLLDAQSNNISPATNIESLYYEINQNGAVYRNAIYKHFPVYVRYNNNVDNAYTVGVNSVAGQTSNGTMTMNDYDTSNGRLTDSKGIIYVSSIEQTRLSGTRFYKLDVRTYNLTNILQQFPTKAWVLKYFNMHDTSIHNIVYESTLPASISSDIYQNMQTPYDVGGIGESSKFNDLNKKTVNYLLDEILYPNISPKVSDIKLQLTQTSVIGVYTADSKSSVHLMNKDTYADVSVGVRHTGGQIQAVYRTTTGNLENVANDMCDFAQKDSGVVFSDLGECRACEVETISLTSSKQLKDLHTLRGYTSMDATKILSAATIHAVDIDGLYDSCRTYGEANSASQCQIDCSLYYNVDMCMPVLGYIGEPDVVYSLGSWEAYCQNYIEQQLRPSDLSWDYVDKLGECTAEFWYAASRPMYFYLPVITAIDQAGYGITFNNPYVSWVNSGIGWSQCHYGLEQITISTTPVGIYMHYNVADNGKRGVLTRKSEGVTIPQSYFHVYKLASIWGDLSDAYNTGDMTYANADKPYMKIRVTFKVTKAIQ